MSLYNSTDLYEPADLEGEMFLSDIPVQLLEQSIKTQFDDPFEYRKRDYVQSFITNYDFSKENMIEDELTHLDEIHDDFIEYMRNILNTYLNIGFPNIEDLNDDTSNEVIHMTYRFFIKNIKRNFINLICNFIETRPEYVNDIIQERSDITTESFKNEIDDERDVKLLANLDTVIDHIINQYEFDVDSFFELCAGDELCLELEYVKSKFDSFDITGNFTNKYFEMIDSEFEAVLSSKVRNKILKKYPNRKPVIDEDIDDSNDDSSDSVDKEKEATEI